MMQNFFFGNIKHGSKLRAVPNFEIFLILNFIFLVSYIIQYYLNLTQLRHISKQNATHDSVHLHASFLLVSKNRIT